MKAILKCSDIIKMVNDILPIDTKMAVRYKLNDRKWSDTSDILRKEKIRLSNQIKDIDTAIGFLRGIKEE